MFRKKDYKTQDTGQMM